MFHSKDYIPSPNKWTDYYKSLMNESNNRHGNSISYQVGGSIISNNGSHIMPIEENRGVSNNQKHSDNRKIQLVSPTAQSIEQITSELKREGVDLKKKRRKTKNINKRKPKSKVIAKNVRQSKGRVKSGGKRRGKKHYISKKAKDIFD